jgi:hypothetical protein
MPLAVGCANYRSDRAPVLMVRKMLRLASNAYFPIGRGAQQAGQIGSNAGQLPSAEGNSRMRSLGLSLSFACAGTLVCQVALVYGLAWREIERQKMKI